MFINHKIRNYYYGVLAEYIAIMLLMFKGYHIISRRYKNNLGEIDIIAVKNRILVFIEVKARKTITDYMEVLTNRQKQRIIAAAKLFLAHNNRFINFTIRFDMIILQGLKPKHYQNMW